ncbi:hypothetical protein KPL35_16130 [Clostridium sp. CF011]|uniref:hypothetical protein n=1 Tax=Clostridium sp. CF011 TaxID=2843318 RepID=UPI001C0D9C3F|nr:hypothetical protein [Clostridium sp. CF011]MBU3093588.1 hypothetical protein [Clostridium sp. CF011]WAG71689.1 hypothetical protein LL036_18515 [Clostridium sp. CF011]
MILRLMCFNIGEIHYTYHNRHSFATHLLDADIDGCYIQRLLGQTIITTSTI